MIISGPWRPRRVPIGYRIVHRPDGTKEVHLETAFVAPPGPSVTLSSSQRRVLDDYKASRRAARVSNRRGRGGLAGWPLEDLPPPGPIRFARGL